MAKSYIDTVKYLVYTDVEIHGLVEKPDVVGAIFGQTEGLLGDELDLRAKLIRRKEADIVPVQRVPGPSGGLVLAEEHGHQPEVGQRHL